MLKKRITGFRMRRALVLTVTLLIYLSVIVPLFGTLTLLKFGLILLSCAGVDALLLKVMKTNQLKKYFFKEEATTEGVTK